MRFPLSHRISPAFMLEPDKAAATGGEPPAMGGAFSTMARTLKQDVETPPPAAVEPAPEPKPPAPEPKPKPAAPPEKKEAAPAKSSPASTVPADALKAPEPSKPTPQAPDPSEIEAELMKGLSAPAKLNLGKMRESYEAKLAAKQTELDEAKRMAESPAAAAEAKQLKAELEKLRAEHTEASKTLEVLGVERSPQFQAKYVKGREKLVEDAAKRVTKAGGDASKFKAALDLDGRAKYDAIEAALDGAPGFITNQVAAVVTQIEMLDEEKADAIQQGRGKLTEWAQEETTRQAEEQGQILKAREQSFVNLLPKLAEEVMMLRAVPGEEHAAWNAEVEEVKAQAQNFLFKAEGFEQFAAAAVRAEAYKKLEPKFIAVVKENVELKAQLAALSEADPGGGNPGGGGGGAPDAAPKTFADRVKEGMGIE